MQRFLVSIFFGILVFTTAASSGAAPNAPDAASPLIPVKIGYPQTNYWPLFLARDLGLFKEAGLEPHFHPFTTGAPLITGMTNSELDIAWTGLATVFILGKGIPLTYVLVTMDHSSQVSMVVKLSAGIRSYKDLKKSKAIGAPSGTCAAVSAVLATRKIGMPLSSVNISNLAPNLLLGALQNDQIDTAFIWGPWDLQLREAGFKIVSKDKDYVPGQSVCGVTVAIRPAFLEQHPSVGCKMVKVQALALEAARRHPEKAIESIQKELGLSYKLAKESYETLVIPSIKSQLQPNAPWSLTNETGGLTQKLKMAADALYETKSFSQPLSRDTIWQSIDAKHIKQYLATDCKS